MNDGPRFKRRFVYLFNGGQSVDVVARAGGMPLRRSRSRGYDRRFGNSQHHVWRFREGDILRLRCKRVQTERAQPEQAGRAKTSMAEHHNQDSRSQAMQTRASEGRWPLRFLHGGFGFHRVKAGLIDAANGGVRIGFLAAHRRESAGPGDGRHVVALGNYLDRREVIAERQRA